MSDIKLQGSNFFATFKTEKELKDYIEQHSKEEQRLLWLGVMLVATILLTKSMKHLTLNIKRGRNERT